jgi:hypothetical protein
MQAKKLHLAGILIEEQGRKNKTGNVKSVPCQKVTSLSIA